MGLVHHPNVVSDGLVGCWDAGNRRSYPGAGTTWTDLVLQNAGSMSPSPTFESDKAGVMSFDGTDDIVTINSSTELSALTTGDFSFEAWVNVVDADDVPNRYVCVISLVNAGLILMGHSYPTGKAGVGLLVPHTNPSYENLGTGFTSASFSYGEWVHVACTRTGTTYSTYINGVGGVSTTENGWWDVPDWKIGKGYSSHFFYGDMGAIRVYNRVLTPAEVSQNYEAMKPRFTPRITKSGLVGNWDAGDPESYPGGTTLKDTANGTAATFSNMDGSNFNSANGGYWEFDGTNEHIQCSTSSVLQPQSFSVEAWAKESTDGGELNALPIVTWKSGGSKYPAVYTSYHTAQKPIIFLSGSDYRDFDKTAVSVAGWHHVMFTYTYDDVTTGAFYVDGVRIAAVTTDDGTKDSTDACDIGRADTSLYYKGSIALVRIYDRPLSAAEILDNYNKTKARFGH